MKTIKFNKLVIALTLFLTTVVTQDIFAQGPPPWAPANGYRAKVRHVYFPTQNMYYDLQDRVYIYANGGNWSISASIQTDWWAMHVNCQETCMYSVQWPGL